MITELYHATLLDTLPESQYSPITFIGSISELDNIRREVIQLSSDKGFTVNDVIEQDTVKLITLSSETKEFMEKPDVIYDSVCRWINNKVSIVALIEREYFNFFIEERLRARLMSGVVCNLEEI